MKQSPAQIAGLRKAIVVSKENRMVRREQGLAFARRWRAENKPYFDSIYGPEQPA